MRLFGHSLSFFDGVHKRIQFLHQRHHPSNALTAFLAQAFKCCNRRAHVPYRMPSGRREGEAGPQRVRVGEDGPRAAAPSPELRLERAVLLAAPAAGRRRQHLPQRRLQLGMPAVEEGREAEGRVRVHDVAPHERGRLGHVDEGRRRPGERGLVAVALRRLARDGAAEAEGDGGRAARGDRRRPRVRRHRHGELLEARALLLRGDGHRLPLRLEQDLARRARELSLIHI